MSKLKMNAIMDTHQTMRAHEELKDFFTFVNHDCISYHMERKTDGSITIKWKNIDMNDYQLNNENTIQRINIRLQKMKTEGFLLDCFQWNCGKISWEAFPIKACVGYKIVQSESDNYYDVAFRFDSRELYFQCLSMEMVFLLQQLFGDGFI